MQQLRRKSIHLCFLLVTGLCVTNALSQSTAAYTDTSHASKVFGHPKSYRLYLPDGYATSNKRYPVMYFFHGWGGRHFKDDNALLNYEGIKPLVDKYQVILVMWDGNIDTTEPRPYNTGNHNDVKFDVQEKDYFPELVAHIDASYRTLTDRQHRGIIGFSMGGFMSFFLAGKYPDKVIAAVSLAGSPEFFIGYPANHTLYPVRYTFKNLSDVNIRLHNGDSDILYYLNDEVAMGAKWEGIDLDYWKFHGGHMIDKTGETKVFETAMQFVAGAFAKDSSRPRPRQGWSHYDLYPTFSVWGYDVVTNKKTPGYIFLKNADKKGFGLYTHQWLPDGPSLGVDSILITTAPLYKAGKDYRVTVYDIKTGKLATSTKQADAAGRLSLFYNSTTTQTGIYKDSDGASFVLLDYTTARQTRYLHSGKVNRLSLRLLNRGGELLPGKISVSLSTKDNAIKIIQPAVAVSLTSKDRVITLPAYSIQCNKQPPPHAEPPQIKFTITIKSGSQVFTDDVVVPVLYESPRFDSIQVNDKPTTRGTTNGNGDGIADAGENIALTTGTHRLRLYTEDKWVLAQEEKLEDEIIPARWPDGYTLTSVVKVSPDCPDGHIIEFYASYETKTFNPIERKTTWGKLQLRIRNNRLVK
jgi:enterochelin esterase-like enzyme